MGEPKKCSECGEKMQLTREVEGETILRRYWWCLNIDCDHEEELSKAERVKIEMDALDGLLDLSLIHI